MDAWGLARLDRVDLHRPRLSGAAGAARRGAGRGSATCRGASICSSACPSRGPPPRRGRSSASSAGSSRARTSSPSSRRSRGSAAPGPISPSSSSARSPITPTPTRCGRRLREAGTRRRGAPHRRGAGRRAVRPPLVRLRLGVTRRRARAWPSSKRWRWACRSWPRQDARHRGLPRRGDRRGGRPGDAGRAGARPGAGAGAAGPDAGPSPAGPPSGGAALSLAGGAGRAGRRLRRRPRAATEPVALSLRADTASLRPSTPRACPGASRFSSLTTPSSAISDARRARVPMLNFDRSVSKPSARAKSPLPSAIIRMRSPTPLALAQARDDVDVVHGQAHDRRHALGLERVVLRQVAGQVLVVAGRGERPGHREQHHLLAVEHFAAGGLGRAGRGDGGQGGIGDTVANGDGHRPPMVAEARSGSPAAGER